MLSPRRRSAPFFIILAVLVIVLLYRRNALSPRKLRPVPSVPLNGQAAPGSPADVTSANSTLGFGAIVVVSKDGSSRLPAMIQAANVTGLDLTIPSQPTWTDDDVATFRNGIDAAKRGSILAWMGHRNAMEWWACQCFFFAALTLAQVSGFRPRDGSHPRGRCGLGHPPSQLPGTPCCGCRPFHGAATDQGRQT